MIGAIIGGITAVAGIASSKRAGKDARRAAERAGRMNASNIMAETTEAIRRTEAQNKQFMGQAVAGIGGSGVRQSGSTQNTLTSMATEQQTQLDWMQKSGEAQAQLAIETGGQQGEVAWNQAKSSMIGQFGAFAQSNAANEMYNQFGWI